MGDRSPLSRNAHIKPLFRTTATHVPSSSASSLVILTFSVLAFVLLVVLTLFPGAFTSLAKNRAPRSAPSHIWPPPPHKPAPPAFIPHPPDKCHFYAAAGPSWRFNSRALCLSSSLCLNLSSPAASHRIAAFLPSSPPSATVCQLSTSRFASALPWADRPPSSDTCQGLQRELVSCAHGPGLKRNGPQFPRISAAPAASGRAAWLEHLTLVVPSYPYPANIYHYGNVLASVAHVAGHLQALLEDWGLGHVHAPGGAAAPYFADGIARVTRVNVLFEGSRNTNAWQAKLLEMLWTHRLQKGGVEVETIYLPEWGADEQLCVRNAIVLGRRGSVNVWFFPNATSVPLDGLAVPADAVEFKRAVYKGVSVEARLPEVDAVRVAELPPLVLGYARRLGAQDAKGGNVHLVGTKRRFSDDDEAWFVEMLRNETDASGVKLHMFTTSANDSLAEQVRNIAGVGFVVGIHGANLVNAVFMHPFGALLEIFPGNADSPCYIAGSNSGLAYYRHTSTEEATPAETGCSLEDRICQKKTRQRLVKIGRAEDREAVRGHVKMGLRHLTALHQKYPGGVPVTYDEKSDYYYVDASA